VTFYESLHKNNLASGIWAFPSHRNLQEWCYTHGRPCVSPKCSQLSHGRPCESLQHFGYAHGRPADDDT